MMTPEEFAQAAYDQFRIQAEGSFLVRFAVHDQEQPDAKYRDILYEALSIPLPADSARYIRWPSLPFSLQEYETREEATDAAINQIDAWNTLINQNFANHGIAAWVTFIKISARFESNVREFYNAEEWNRTILTNNQDYPNIAMIVPSLLNAFDVYLAQFIGPDCELAISSGLDYNRALWEHIQDETRRTQLWTSVQNSGFLCVKSD